MQPSICISAHLCLHCSSHSYILYIVYKEYPMAKRRSKQLRWPTDGQTDNILWISNVEKHDDAHKSKFRKRERKKQNKGLTVFTYALHQNPRYLLQHSINVDGGNREKGVCGLDEWEEQIKPCFASHSYCITTCYGRHFRPLEARLHLLSPLALGLFF